MVSASLSGIPKRQPRTPRPETPTRFDESPKRPDHAIAAGCHSAPAPSCLTQLGKRRQSDCVFGAKRLRNRQAFAGTGGDSLHKPLAVPLHPRNSKLASAQSGVHGPPMHDFKRELRAIRDRLAKQDVSIQDWAAAADVSHTTLWRILERGQTPSVSTYQALICAEKKFAPMQK